MTEASSADWVYLGVGGHVLALDAASGKECWRYRLGMGSVTTVQRSGSRIFAGSSGELTCLDATSGALLWKNKLPGMGFGPIIFAADPGPAALESGHQNGTVG